MVLIVATTRGEAGSLACFPDWEKHVPRYFFNRVDGKRDQDVDGLELPNVDHARYEAVAFAADTLKDDSFALWDGGEVRIEVADSMQLVIFTVVISAIHQTAEQAS